MLINIITLLIKQVKELKKIVIDIYFNRIADIMKNNKSIKEMILVRVKRMTFL